MQIDGKPRAVEIQAARVFKLPNLITNLIGYTGLPIELFLTVGHVMNSPLVWSPKYEVDSAAYPSNTDLLQQMI
jgi:hypothetical protein